MRVLKTKDHFKRNVDNVNVKSLPVQQDITSTAERDVSVCPATWVGYTLTKRKVKEELHGWAAYD